MVIGQIITKQIAKVALTKIAQDPSIIGKILDSFGQMPNIPTSTMGGKFFWTDIENVNGWRLQKNNVFGNCRIIDPNNVRRAWGGEDAMLKAFNKL